MSRLRFIACGLTFDVICTFPFRCPFNAQVVDLLQNIIHRIAVVARKAVSETKTLRESVSGARGCSSNMRAMRTCLRRQYSPSDVSFHEARACANTSRRRSHAAWTPDQVQSIEA
jgi:hypothetical protein